MVFHTKAAITIKLQVREGVLAVAVRMTTDAVAVVLSMLLRASLVEYCSALQGSVRKELYAEK